PRPLGYEPNELPDCSTPRHVSASSAQQHLRIPRRQGRVKHVPLASAALTVDQNRRVPGGRQREQEKLEAEA
ncbi:MAG: hypothetical protein AABY89_09370, partial [Acidobacteriota bacterium]